MTNANKYPSQIRKPTLTLTDGRYPGFLITDAYTRFVEFCDLCRRKQWIGLCTGTLGVGKTVSAINYSMWHVIGALGSVGLRRSKYVKLAPQVALCRTVLYTPHVASSPLGILSTITNFRKKLSRAVVDAQHIKLSDIIDATEDFTELIIVDNAARLTKQGLSQLFSIYEDSSQFGLILLGKPDFQNYLAKYPRLNERIQGIHYFTSITYDEVLLVCASKWEILGLAFNPDNPHTQDAIQLICELTKLNFRRIERLFDLISRVLQINQLKLIDIDVVLTARAMLVWGDE